MTKRRRYEYNIKVYLKELRLEDVEWAQSSKSVKGVLPGCC
jgi:hypothetical protein